MAGIDLCTECGVPRYITSEHLWVDSGAIIQSRESEIRMIFIECENLDPLFRGIENLIGMPIEHAVTAAKRKAVRSYQDRLIPEATKELLRKRKIDWRQLNNGLIAMAGIHGYGK